MIIQSQEFWDFIIIVVFLYSKKLTQMSFFWNRTILICLYRPVFAIIYGKLCGFRDDYGVDLVDIVAQLG